jgi:hypothetical protein
MSNTKLLENPFSEIRVVPCGEHDRKLDKQTDRKKLTVVFCKYVNAFKITCGPHTSVIVIM